MVFITDSVIDRGKLKISFISDTRHKSTLVTVLGLKVSCSSSYFFLLWDLMYTFFFLSPLGMFIFPKQ